VGIIFQAQPFYVRGLDADNVESCQKAVWGAFFTYVASFSISLFIMKTQDPNIVEEEEQLDSGYNASYAEAVSRSRSQPLPAGGDVQMLPTNVKVRMLA